MATEYFCKITERSENKEDRSGNTYATFRINAVAAVTRMNPLTGEQETCAGAGRTFTVNAWQGGVDSPWNHIFDQKAGQPVIGTPMTVDVDPYEIDGNEYNRATIFVPDTQDSPTWAKSFDTVLRWDNFTLAGEFALPIDVIEETGEKVTKKATKAAELDI
jgi:hypothetical protein